MAACFTHTEETEGKVLVEKLTGVASQTQEQWCPMVRVLPVIIKIDSIDVIRSVSIVHHCTNTCKFVRNSKHFIEREAVTNTNKLSVQHDYSNDLFLYNMYAL